MNIFSRKLFCLPLCQLLEVQISVHENSHYPFPEESKNIHTRKWDADQYFQTGKCYISVVAHCCALQLTDISVSETGLRFISCQYAVCKRYKITFTACTEIWTSSNWQSGKQNNFLLNIFIIVFSSSISTNRLIRNFGIFLRNNFNLLVFIPICLLNQRFLGVCIAHLIYK
jgi:hypothetical protein